jgi:hypothetical protein
MGNVAASQSTATPRWPQPLALSRRNQERAADHRRRACRYFEALAFKILDAHEGIRNCLTQASNAASTLGLPPLTSFSLPAVSDSGVGIKFE